MPSWPRRSTTVFSGALLRPHLFSYHLSVDEHLSVVDERLQRTFRMYREFHLLVTVFILKTLVLVHSSS